MKTPRWFCQTLVMITCILCMNGLLIAQPSLTQSIVPQFIQGRNGTNAQRIPCAYRVTIAGLTPSATYRYFNQVVRSSDAVTSNGAGNVIYATTGGFTRSTSPGMSAAGSYGEFTADASGSCSLWLISEPTGNARFTAGGYVFFRIMLNDGNGGTTVATRLTTPDSMRVLSLAATNADSSGTGIRGRTMAVGRDFLLLYDNISGSGRPLAVTFIESDGTDNSTSNSYVGFYADSVNTIEGAFGSIVPNNNPSGVRRVERRSATGEIVAFNQSVSGIWPSGANTVNPVGAATPIVLTVADVPLTSSTNVPPSITFVSRDPLAPVHNSVVNVTARISDLDGMIYSATLFFNPGTGYQSVDMFDDGSHNDSSAGDGCYGGQIPLEPSQTMVRYYLEAVDNAGGTTRYPADAPTHTLSYRVDRQQPALVINEFMAQNTSTIQDPTGEWADWLELFNPGTDTVWLEGFGMTDDFTDLHQWEFPDTFITPAGYLFVWCDQDEGDPGIHANFKLSTSGEQIALSDQTAYGSVILDSISFGQQSANVSMARECDSSLNWILQSAPTPDATNGLCQPGGLTVCNQDNDVILHWNPSPGAAQYQVFRMLNAEESIATGTLITIVNTNTVTLAGESADQTRAFYLIVAVKP